MKFFYLYCQCVAFQGEFFTSTVSIQVPGTFPYLYCQYTGASDIFLPLSQYIGARDIALPLLLVYRCQGHFPTSTVSIQVPGTCPYLYCQNIGAKDLYCQYKGARDISLPLQSGVVGWCDGSG